MGEREILRSERVSHDGVRHPSSPLFVRMQLPWTGPQGSRDTFAYFLRPRAKLPPRVYGIHRTIWVEPPAGGLPVCQGSDSGHGERMDTRDPVPELL